LCSKTDNWFLAISDEVRYGPRPRKQAAVAYLFIKDGTGEPVVGMFRTWLQAVLVLSATNICLAGSPMRSPATALRQLPPLSATRYQSNPQTPACQLLSAIVSRSAAAAAAVTGAVSAPRLAVDHTKH
jgi:hypothetical protein